MSEHISYDYKGIIHKITIDHHVQGTFLFLGPFHEKKNTWISRPFPWKKKNISACLSQINAFFKVHVLKARQSNL